MSLLDSQDYFEPHKVQVEKANEVASGFKEMSDVYQEESLRVKWVVALLEKKGFTINKWEDNAVTLTQTQTPALSPDRPNKGFGLEVCFSLDVASPSSDGLKVSAEEESYDEQSEATVGPGIDPPEDEEFSLESLPEEFPKLFDWHPVLFRLSKRGTRTSLLGKAFVDGDTGKILLNNITPQALPPPLTSFPPLCSATPMPPSSEWLDVHKISPMIRHDLYELLSSLGLSDNTGRAISFLLLAHEHEKMHQTMGTLSTFFRI